MVEVQVPLRVDGRLQAASPSPTGTGTCLSTLQGNLRRTLAGGHDGKNGSLAGEIVCMELRHVENERLQLRERRSGQHPA